MKSLIYISASYPYGQKETYLHNEINAIAKDYEHVFVIPTYNPYSSFINRDLPDNVIILSPVLKRGFRRVIQFLIKFTFISSFFADLVKNKVFLSKSKLKLWFNSYVSYLTVVDVLASLINKLDKKNIIVYSYWADAPFFISKQFKEIKKVARLHGADFYIERNNGYLPIRNLIYNNTDLLLPISNDIYNRLISQYNMDSRKLYLSYLGVFNNVKKCTIKIIRNQLNIVSCSNVYALKRIDKIYEVLLNLNSDIQVNWTHIGSGEILTDLQHKVESQRKENIKVHFLGFKNQHEIYDIYENTFFDFFINTSEHEGLPVSIMEAFSFGIPAIATNVGGTSEIVNENNGMLISKNFDPVTLARDIEYKFLEPTQNLRVNAYTTWLEKFNGCRNYSLLSQVLKSNKL